MESHAPPERSSGSKRHSKNVSVRVRSSTKGPLDLDDPSAIDPLRTSADEPRSSVSAQLPTHTAYDAGSPRTQIVSDAFLASAVPSSPQQSKDLSFLLDPSIFHVVPPSLQQVQKAPPAHHLTVDSIPSILSARKYRAAAELTAHRLTHSPIPSQNETLYFFYVRLACLVLLNHTDLAAQESKALEDISSPFYRCDSIQRKSGNVSTSDDPGAGEGGSILPWELQVLWARLTGIAHGDVHKSISAFYELARHARRAYRACKGGDTDEKDLWRRRLKELGLGVASVLVESGDLEGAARHLEGLCTRASDEAKLGTNELRSSNRSDHVMDAMLVNRTVLVYLALGDAEAAITLLGTSSSSSSNRMGLLPPMISIIEGRYHEAASQLRALLKADGVSDKTIILQNLAVCLFYTGHVDQAVQIFNSIIDGSPTDPFSSPSHLDQRDQDPAQLPEGHGNHEANQTSDSNLTGTADDQDDTGTSPVKPAARSFHALTFNLATCFELTSERAAMKKAKLADRVMNQLREQGSHAERSPELDFKISVS